MNKFVHGYHHNALCVLFFLIGLSMTVTCFAKEVSEDIIKKNGQADAIILGLSMLQSQNLLVTPLLIEPSVGSDNSYFVDFFYLGTSAFSIEKKQFLAQLKVTEQRKITDPVATIRIASVNRNKLPVLSPFIQQAIISSAIYIRGAGSVIINVNKNDANGEVFVLFLRLPAMVGAHSTVIVTPNSLTFVGGR